MSDENNNIEDTRGKNVVDGKVVADVTGRVSGKTDAPKPETDVTSGHTAVTKTAPTPKTDLAAGSDLSKAVVNGSSTPRVADYGLLKSKNLVETLLETDNLPSKADCASLLELKVEPNSPTHYTQVMVKGMLGGSTIPIKRQLEKLLSLIDDAS